MKKNYIIPHSESLEVFPESPLLIGGSFKTNAPSEDVDGSSRSIHKQSIWKQP